MKDLWWRKRPDFQEYNNHGDGGGNAVYIFDILNITKEIQIHFAL